MDKQTILTKEMFPTKEWKQDKNFDYIFTNGTHELSFIDKYVICDHQLIVSYRDLLKIIKG